MPRRRYAREFKISAVKLVNEQGYSISDAAKSLGVDPANVRLWVEKFSTATSDDGGVALSGEGALRAELRRLRKENARLLMDNPGQPPISRRSVLSLLPYAGPVR